MIYFLTITLKWYYPLSVVQFLLKIGRFNDNEIESKIDIFQKIIMYKGNMILQI
jgi:hypothetical protein